MSRNLVEIVRRHHAVGAPTALEVLKEAMERRGLSGATGSAPRSRLICNLALMCGKVGRPGSRCCRPYKPPGSEASDEFPLVLVTGRRLEHYNAGTMTRHTGDPDLMHPDAAARLWVADGDLVSVRSPHGRIELAARLTERIEPVHVFTAFHFPEIRTNLLVGSAADVNASCPEYKVVAVDVRPVAAQASRTPAIAAAT